MYVDTNKYQSRPTRRHLSGFIERNHLILEREFRVHTIDDHAHIAN